jgi:hypothetical protein
MNIETVKLQSESYLVNGTLSVPKAEGNRHYKLVQEWIAEGNTPEPEFTEAELADQKKANDITEAKQYLAESDWIVTKIAELQLEGVDVEPLKAKYADELAERKLMREVV